MNNKNHIFTALLLIVFIAPIFGQGITKEVYVTSNFKPEIEQVDKINHLPQVDDTIVAVPVTNIMVMPSRIETRYDVRAIKPAKIVANPLDKLYNSYLKLGFGNHVTPLAEFNIHNLRSKKYTYGAYGYHKSMNRKEIELADDLTASDNYSTNKIGAYGKMFLNGVIIDGNTGLNTHAFHYYGINTNNNVTNEDLPNDVFNKQRYSDLSFNGSLSSNTPDSNALHYRSQINAYHFFDKDDNKESNFNTINSINYMVSGLMLGTNVNFTYSRFAPEQGANKLNVLWEINPTVKKRKKDWEFKLGAKAVHNRFDTTRWYFYPDVYIRFSIMPDVLQTYFGLTGHLQQQTYKKLANENPFIKPGLIADGVPNTNHNFVGYGGLMGSLGKKGGFKLDARYDISENSNFYILKASQNNTDPENQFINFTDNVELLTLTGEINYAPIPELGFYLVSQYNNYQMSTVGAKPYLKPIISTTFTTTYNFHKKVYLKSDLLYNSQRYVLRPLADNLTLDEKNDVVGQYWDLNISGEYIYSNVLTFFIDFHNILNNNYQIWHNYPTEGFNMVAGLSYKL